MAFRLHNKSGYCAIRISHASWKRRRIWVGCIYESFAAVNIPVCSITLVLVTKISPIEQYIQTASRRISYGESVSILTAAPKSVYSCNP